MGSRRRRALLAAAGQIEGLTLEAVSCLWSSDPYAYRADRRENVDEVAFGVDLETREGPDVPIRVADV